MLLSMKGLTGYRIQATDGEIGRVKDLLFEEDTRAIRYLVVATGGWLVRREVLLSPSALGLPDGKEELIPVELTREEVKNSPDISTDLPLSREKERLIFNYYNWPIYWMPGPGFGASIPPVPVPPEEEQKAEESEEETDLRSAKEVIGYGVRARDGDIGHIEDLVLDDKAWVLRYLAVDTRDWLPGKKVLVAVQWLEEIDWLEKKVSADLSQKEIEKSPPYDPSAPVNREYEDRLFDYYGKPKYWE
jgi:sporulation protein YlmC with PRC-barrel domain